jgi:hypothetical protein
VVPHAVGDRNGVHPELLALRRFHPDIAIGFVRFHIRDGCVRGVVLEGWLGEVGMLRQFVIDLVQFRCFDRCLNNSRAIAGF